MLLLIIIKKIRLIEEPPPKIHSLPSLMSSFKRSVLSPIGYHPSRARLSMCWFVLYFRQSGECIQLCQCQLSKEMQPWTAAEVSKWDHHGGGAGGAHEQVCGRHKERGAQEGGLARYRIWSVENRSHSPVQNPRQETEWAERRGQDPPECLLPRVGENRHGRTQSPQKPRRRSRDPRVLGPSALGCRGASPRVHFWEKSSAMVSSFTATPWIHLYCCPRFTKQTLTKLSLCRKKKEESKYPDQGLTRRGLLIL